MARFRFTSAHAIALMALFIALGGAAYAGLKVNSSAVNNNSLKSVDLKNKKGVKGVDVVNNSLDGTDIRNNSLGGVEIQDGGLGKADLATDQQTQWALVSQAGEIIAQSGGISLSAGGGGLYTLNFGRDLSGVPLSATLSSRQTTGGEVAVEPCGGPPEGAIGTCGAAFDNRNHLHVQTMNSAGAIAARAFYVAALAK